jgi:hypothetical protein
VYVQLQGKCKDNRLGEGDPDVETVVAMCRCRVGVNVLVVIAVPSWAGYRVGVNVFGGWPSGPRRQVRERAAG